MYPFTRAFGTAPRRLRLLLAASVAALLTACGGGGGLDPILGTPGVGALPRVTATTPVDSTPVVTGVAVNSSVSAAFSEPMSAATLTPSSFTLACPAGTVLGASVTYNEATRVATLTPSAALPAGVRCTATIGSAVQDTMGYALASAYVWGFVTAPAADVTRPAVTMTSPAAGAVNVANNMQIAVTFSEDMNPASLSGDTFTLVEDASGKAVAGRVSYSTAGRTAMFTPGTPATLAAGTRFRATVTTGATDLAGNALAANHVWSFTTAAAPDTTAPTVVITVPAANATAVPINTAISATFSEAMNPALISSSSFTVIDTTLGRAIPGTVTYSATSRTAVFTPATPAALAANSRFMATITTGVADAAGNALAANYVWTFTTAALTDTTRPSVVLTVPQANAGAVPVDTSISASFSEPMDPATISASSFTVFNSTLGSAVNGLVSYSAAGRTATFTPTAPATLAAGSVFTATITAAATDVAGNALAGNSAVLPNAGSHGWTFTTAAPGGTTAPPGGSDTVPQGDITAPTVIAISPQDGSSSLCLGTVVSARFSEPMAAGSIGSSTFTVTGFGAEVAGTVSYDAASRVATYLPSATGGFAPGRPFVATVKGGITGVKDVAGNPLTLDRTWTFTTGTQACLGAVDLRSAAAFVGFGGNAGVTSQGINTVLGGNLGSTAVCSAITGVHDASNAYTETPLNVGAVNGSIYCAPPAPGTPATLAIATQARADAQTAYNALAALPAGGDPGSGQLGGRVLPAAVYTAAGGSFSITSGDLTLDAQGDVNAVWVFQSTASLTVGQPALPRRVLLINGAQAKNVFWQVGGSARIEDRSVMEGTIIARAGVTLSTPGQTAQTVLTGRAIGLDGPVTMVNTTIVAP